ncbi:pyridoxal phosphate-dependent aminotransferase [Plasticicumulans acidivorans]|uniref:Aminotransferase n=1 Tax=Plasticicumulans acidivorans TaxID=886464 RepID=A0A317MR92_9GAMM|nr:pyridoxal phosphate-dependent aminotransferase [Plasticicumulans acidivorans]PWV58831.1 L-aspartate aminotransferase [Plasticicumulans acidivorans]
MPVVYPRVARRMADIAPFHVMELLARAQQLAATGRSIIHMEVGEPDFSTAAPIVAAGRQALAEGRTGYTSACGLPALREAIAANYARRHGVDVDPGCIVVTPGASGALLLAAGVLMNPGERCLLADPTYPCNRHFLRFCEGEAVGIPVGADTAFQLTPELVDQHWDAQTRAVMLASPANPTGTLVPPAVMQGIREIVRAHGGALIVDEIYHGLVYDEPAVTALAGGDDVFVVNSFSKYYGMTGWRLGWLVAPPPCVRDVEKLMQNLLIAAPTPAQYAALAAFTPEAEAIFEERRLAFRQRRDFLVPALRAIGFEVPVMPQGAFYVYADASRFTDDSYSFCFRVLEETGVAITPGIDFGEYQAGRYVRFAYTTSLEALQDGVDRLQRFLH